MLIPRKSIEEEENREGIPGWSIPSERIAAQSTHSPDRETSLNGMDAASQPPLSTSKGTSKVEDICCPGLEDLFDSQFFKALSDPNRIAILAELARKGRPCTVTELSECCPRDLSVVSRHLTALRDAGVVKSERKGKQVYYWVRVIDVADRMRGIVASLTELANRYRTLGDESVEMKDEAGNNRE
ncbi:MAG: metalloregulator ArsR/SmtB family transcription factor [bacterium]